MTLNNIRRLRVETRSRQAVCKWLVSRILYGIYKLLDGTCHQKVGENMNLLVENPMVLGTIERVKQVPTFRYVERDFRDKYGSLIVSNDDYMKFPNGDIVHLDNLHTYAEERFKAEFCTKK